MATDTLSIEYKAFEDCERVVLHFCGRRLVFVFDSFRELDEFMRLDEVPADIAAEVFADVTRHRMADQAPCEDHSPPCSRRALRATEELPAGGTDSHGCEPAGFSCHGRELLRTNTCLKFWLAASFCVIAGLVVYGRFN